MLRPQQKDKAGDKKAEAAAAAAAAAAKEEEEDANAAGATLSDMFNYTKQHLLRVYPAGWRVRCSPESMTLQPPT